MGGKRKADDEGKGKEVESVEVGPGMQSLIEVCESLEGMTVEEALAEHCHTVDVDDDEALMELAIELMEDRRKPDKDTSPTPGQIEGSFDTLTD